MGWVNKTVHITQNMCLNTPSSTRSDGKTLGWTHSQEVRLLGIHMGSFPHPTHYFAAAGENDDIVITAINFMLNQSL